MVYECNYSIIFPGSMIRKGGFIKVEALNEVTAQVKAMVKLENDNPNGKVVITYVSKLNN